MFDKLMHKTIHYPTISTIPLKSAFAVIISLDPENNPVK